MQLSDLALAPVFQLVLRNALQGAIVSENDNSGRIL
jgi:hypothetical protein